MSDKTEAEIAELLDERYVRVTQERYDKKLAEIGMRLRALAETVEREGRARRGSIDDDGQPDYAWAARDVIHAVTWGLANLDLPGLLSEASAAHAAVRGRIK